MINRDFASFLEGGVAIHIGTRDDRLQPTGARCVAATVDEGGEHLTVYLARVAARRILPNLESNGQAAVVFVRPTDDRSCQVKGTFVSARPARPRERPLLDEQWNGFMDELGRIGIPRLALLGWVTWPAVAIRLKPTALFEQTPGPQAGEPIR